ncbi:helicase [Ktedonobacteria bacterium brp13]|nr:helicase [Ktedonobacteria bacterium brp13]
MQILRLPQQLPPHSVLASINKGLLNNELRLDWSDVTVPPRPDQLAILFKRLNLTEHFDSIGGDTIPEAIVPAIQEAFNTLERQQADQTSPLPPLHPVPVKPITIPPLWLPEDEATSSGNDTPRPRVTSMLPPEEEEFETIQFIEDEAEKTVLKRISDELKAEMAQTPLTPLTLTAAEPQSILAVPTPAALRDELEGMVIRDLLGPAGGADEEVEDDRVRDRYLVGLVAPNDAQIAAEELDSTGTIEEGSEDSGVTDTDASQTTSLSPSSIGMSFCVNLQASHIQVTASWGQYQKGESAVSKTAKGQPKRVWQRTQRGGKPYPLYLTEGPIEPWEPEPDEQPGVLVKGLIRRAHDYWTVTLFLVNGQSMPKRLRDSAWLFQPELSVAAPDGGPIFQRRPSASQRLYKEEDKALAMLYRKQVSFAVGHGIGVHAETLPTDPTAAIRLTTAVVPGYEVPRTEAPSATELPALAELCLDMLLLADASTHELTRMLQPLANAYSTWIDEQKRRLNDPREELQSYHDTAIKAIQQCQQALERITAGIKLLSDSPDAARAFTFMNRTMWLQRIHTLVAEERRRAGSRTLHDINIPANRSWRPFQLAFILLNLPSLTDLNHPERSTSPGAIADLLWFPTGGGKTEAYLGLTAYTLGIRRLQGTIAGRSGQDGVAVLMRYTLRLLTLQQFQRAAALICACEAIRRTELALWGSTPFRLGLWVGQRSTPNTTSDSNEAVKGFRDNSVGYSGGYGNPRQLTHCPWCGTEIDAGTDILVETYEQGRGRTFMYCGDPEGRCSFTKANSNGEGLPVLVVDEEIYRLLPSLIIATVDKFAQLPWRGETQMLFGQVDKYCERHGFRSPDIKDKDSHPAQGRMGKTRSSEHGPLRPPDLIIQDELHLIAGPLGTLVGLYETGVDYLATWEVNGQAVRPKVIAATATIRQASQQIQSLFQRQTMIFPPQGIDIEDNFFSRQRRPGPEQPGRRYLGICANGRRMKAAQIRVYLAYLAAAQAISDRYGSQAADPWLTLIGYFNSMSELGGMRHLIDDDISNRIRKMDQRGLGKRSRLNLKELTSRVSSTDIPEVLSNLEQSFGVEGNKTSKAIDVLLATNMISVGVDVKRLSLMVVVGQPKTTSEYIQATSRVGRTFPGLVCAIYNWARPRDLSHYEQFEHYHATFYQQVEALSVTPFAPRALDRGLAALLTSIIRLSGPQFNRNSAAGEITADIPDFARASAAITRRADEVANIEISARVQEELQKLIQYWNKEANGYASLGYKKENNGKTTNLLKEPARGKWEPFTCLNSLRNVEPNVHLLLDERGLGEPADTIQQEETAE